nr:acyl-CoA dehydrogenase [Sphingomonas sp. CDS-1]
MALIDRQDVDFLLQDWLGIGELLRRSVFAQHDEVTLQGLLDLAGTLGEKSLLPHYKASDAQEPQLLADGTVAILPETCEALRTLVDSGLFSAPFAEDLGGLGVPQTIFVAALGLLMAGNISTAAFLMLTAANARLIAAFGSPVQIDMFARPQIAGEAFGTMCLSEPQAGSGLGDITTRAVPDGEDALGQRYRLTGTKMWISGGAHDASGNIVHLVLAKVPGPDGKLIEGSKGISLFIVPKRLPSGKANDIAVGGLNHKMGYRGIPNCLLNFGEGGAHPGGTSGAVGWMVGQPGDGLAQMFQMMNEARIGVGLGGAILACRAFALSRLYASERTQGRRSDSSAPVPINRHPDVRRMLLNQKVYAEGSLALVLFAARLVDDETTAGTPEARESAGNLLGLITPVVKAWPSVWGLAANDIAIQIHGGYGYTRDFDVEQLYRDGRLNQIHEGTTGIQALDLVGRKILMDGGEAFRALYGRIAGELAAIRGLEGLENAAEEVNAAWRTIAETVNVMVARDRNIMLDRASAFLSAFGHAVVGWLWLSQAVTAVRKLSDTTAQTRPFFEGKIAACRHFVHYELPRIDRWAGLVTAPNDSWSDVATELLAPL